MLSFPEYPLFDESLLDPAPARCVSAVIATYNRAPHAADGPHADDNPLDVCLRALSEQRRAPLLEVVVVDDSSSDHTAAVVERWRAALSAVNVQLEYVRTANRVDAHAARNLGAERARGRLLYLLDDDSVIPPHALAGACAYYVRTKARFGALAALALPVYQRATVPVSQRPAESIATLDRARGEVRGGFECFPSEYADGDAQYLDDEQRWLTPIPVHNLCGAHALLERSALLAAGGFPALPTRGYGGETGLALALLRAGREIRLVVDPRVHAVHLRYGNACDAGLTGDDWRAYLGLASPTLERMVEVSARPRADTGCRVSPAVWHYARVRNNLWLMAEHEPPLAEVYRVHARRAFVEGGSLGNVSEAIASRSERERIFRLAEADAAHLPQQTLEQLGERLKVPPISVVLLNYRRPENVRRIVQCLGQDPLIDDITIWNNDPRTALHAEGDLAGVSVLDASENNLLGRYAAALLARHECVLIQDDDLIVPAATVVALYEHHCREPELVHGVFGRDPRPDGSYALEANQVDRDVDVVLTRCLIVHRRLLCAFFAESAPFQLEEARPPGNGEDIVLSYVARKRSGRKNRVHALFVEELPAPEPVHRLPFHREHRTRLMRQCLRWCGLGAEPPLAAKPGP